MIEFFVPGKAVAQSRPRFARRGNFVQTYDAAPAKDYKSWVKSCALDEMARIGMTTIPRDVPLYLKLLIYIDRPKSKKKAVYPVTKPDCDNVQKGIQDAMESIVYAADQQIVNTAVQKRYGESPGVWVTIKEVKC